MRPERRDERSGPMGATEKRRRDEGLGIVVAFSAMVRLGRSYQMSNDVVRHQLESLVTQIGPMLEEWGEVVIVPLDSDLFLNGVRVPVDGTSFKFHRTVLEAFRNRGISGVSIAKGVSVRDLEKFFELFLQKDGLQGRAFLQACEAAGVQHIQSAIHASTLMPGDETDVELDDEGSAGDGEGASGAPAGGSVGRAGAGTGAGAERGVGGGGRFGGGARTRAAQAVHGARSLLMTTALQSGLEMRHAKRVVQPIVDGAFASEPMVVGLSGLSHHDEYTYAHAVSVCAIAVAIGHALGLDRRTLADLGVAGLLHDVGKSEVAEQIRHHASAFTAEERVAAELHPVEGARLLARTTTLNPTTVRSLRVALEHHAFGPDEGYPRFTPGWTPSRLSAIVAIADAYVSLQMMRGEGEALTPHQALGKILGPLASRFDPALRWALVQSVGIYPPGTLVELDEGSIAIVLEPNPKDVGRPGVRVVIDASGRALEPAQMILLRPLPAERSVKRALRRDEVPAETTPEGNGDAADDRKAA